MDLHKCVNVRNVSELKQHEFRLTFHCSLDFDGPFGSFFCELIFPSKSIHPLTTSNSFAPLKNNLGIWGFTDEASACYIKCFTLNDFVSNHSSSMSTYKFLQPLYNLKTLRRIDY